MTLRSGLAAQIGYAAESTPGTAVTVTQFLPLVSESLTNEIERMESEGIIAGRRVLATSQWASGKIEISGDIQHELYNRNLGRIFNQMFGTAAVSGSGPYTHTFTPGTLTTKALSVQIGRPDIGGTVRPFGFAGVKITSWELAVSEGEIATLGLSVVAMSEDSDGTPALAAASYTSGLVPLHFVHGAITIGGSAVPVKEAKISGDLGLAVERRFLGQANIGEPLEAELRTYDGSLTVEFTNMTQYNRYLDGDEFALVLAFTAGADTVTITMNVRYDGESPQVAGRDILEQNLSFKAIGTTDAAAITAVLVNGDSAI